MSELSAYLVDDGQHPSQDADVEAELHKRARFLRDRDTWSTDFECLHGDQSGGEFPNFGDLCGSRKPEVESHGVDLTDVRGSRIDQDIHEQTRVTSDGPVSVHRCA